jgi:hypothetical protein
MLMVGGLYNVLWGKRIEQVAMRTQEERLKVACSELEELENGAPVQATLRFDRDRTWCGKKGRHNKLKLSAPQCRTDL